jgi:LacI family transcriptional regulator
MYDVARESGVSQATVSLVLNSVAGVRVSEVTRARIIEAAERLQYRRSSRVRAARREVSSIGLVIDDLMASPFAVPFMEGAREAAWEEQCVVDVVSTRNHLPLEQAAIESMLQRPIAGIIYATLFTREVTPPAVPADVPLVLLNCYDAAGACAAALPDDRGAAEKLVRAMVNAGHRRIAHIAGEVFLDAGRDRFAGYRDALTAAGIAFAPELVVTLGSAIEAAYDGTGALLDLPEPPTAIFCFNDRMALAAYQAAHDRGLSVPRDLSIAGFDNDPLVTAFFPNLTTAVLPHETMARWAVRQIFEARTGRRGPRPPRQTMACQLVRRRSIARPRG